jgi:GTPase
VNKKDDLKRDMLRKKGLVIVDKDLKSSYWEFDLDAVILHNATTIQEKYQAIVHVGCVRQAARVVDIQGKECLRTKDKGLIRFRFMYKPEYIIPGSIVLFREGRTRGLGVITHVFN